eukprot:TRINITY_DN2082_c0_g1_i1.p1 TRINITY_DN2082_c0_g1~~TRINITY_DN2082_c0_g1_i1.p1  ORF type:complete len:471 (+),score=64.07 TRINITY_DN2082_c0_g1_i1:256-1668(+)
MDRNNYGEGSSNRDHFNRGVPVMNISPHYPFIPLYEKGHFNNFYNENEDYDRERYSKRRRFHYDDKSISKNKFPSPKKGSSISTTKESKVAKSSERNRKKGKERKEKTPSKYDDKNHHLIIQLGQDLTPRYKILSVVGEGTFGLVVECWDREKRRYVAVKIVRALERYYDAAMLEVKILENIRKHDPKKRYPCIQLKSWFDLHGHACLVFEKLGLSLYDTLKANRYRPFSIWKIKHIGFQLLTAIKFLHSELKLTHTDLKPENILFVNQSSKERDSRFEIEEIKLIDFGSATYEDEHHTSVISTRHYRAPEVILDLGWTYPCDIWSVGCILIELYTGSVLFQTHDNREHLALMESILGDFPSHLIVKSRKRYKYFKNNFVLWPCYDDKKENQDREKLQSRYQYVKNHQSLEDILYDELEFLDMVRRMLDYDPLRRISAREALRHPFFDDVCKYYDRYGSLIEKPSTREHR